MFDNILPNIFYITLIMKMPVTQADKKPARAKSYFLIIFHAFADVLPSLAVSPVSIWSIEPRETNGRTPLLLLFVLPFELYKLFALTLLLLALRTLKFALDELRLTHGEASLYNYALLYRRFRSI